MREALILLGLFIAVGLFFPIHSIAENIGTNVEQKPDLSKPVVNLLLKSAIKQFKEEKSEWASKEFVKQMNSAHFLVAIITDELKVTPSNQEGKVTFQKGGLIKFVGIYNSNKDEYLPVFTDWDEIRAWSKQKVDTMVMSINDVQALLSDNKNWKGLVINPMGNRWTMGLQQVNAVIEDGKK